MKLGTVLPHAGKHATRENIIKLAEGAEAAGLDSLWVTERLLWPMDPQTPYPGSPDGKLPPENQEVHDALTLLAFAAAHTHRVQLGTAVVNLTFHHLVPLAKAFATLDLLSSGRAVCGLGLGWSKDEYDVSHVPYCNRGARADEFVQAIQRIWEDEVVEYQGNFYRIPPSLIGPKPVQQPHPPLLLGGFTTKSLERVVKYADGYVGVLLDGFDTVERQLATLRDRAAKAGRDASSLLYALLTFPRPGPEGGSERAPLVGSLEQIGDDVERLARLGVDHLILGGFAGEGYQVEEALEWARNLKERTAA